MLPDEPLPVGTHCILDLFDCAADRLNDLSFIEALLTRTAAGCGSTLLQHLAHAFEPQGITAVALLAESHLCIHTWPAQRYVAIDLFTCGRHTNPRAVLGALIDAFASGRPVITILSRGFVDGAPTSPVITATPPPPGPECT